MLICAILHAYAVYSYFDVALSPLAFHRLVFSLTSQQMCALCTYSTYICKRMFAAKKQQQHIVHLSTTLVATRVDGR